MSCTNCSEQEKFDFTELDAFIEEKEYFDETALIQVLHHAQGIFGYLPREVQIHVSEKLNVAAAKVYGVVSFYTFFTDVPRGENVIQVCLGTGCFVKGAARVLEAFENELGLKAGETTEDNKFTLSDVRCVGACALAPIVLINDKVYGHVKPEDVKQILENYLIDEAAAS